MRDGHRRGERCTAALTYWQQSSWKDCRQVQAGNYTPDKLTTTTTRHGVHTDKCGSGGLYGSGLATYSMA